MADRPHAEWVPEERAALVVLPRGTSLSRFGYTRRGQHWLHPEEALYLFEEHGLCLCIDGTRAATRLAFSTLLDSPATLRRYTAFLHLLKHGYVCRPSLTRPSPRAGLAPDYDVFDGARFRRGAASRGEVPPVAHLIVADYTEPPPPFGELCELCTWCGAAVLVAVVGGSDVSILEVQAGTPQPERRAPAPQGHGAAAAHLQLPTSPFPCARGENVPVRMGWVRAHAALAALTGGPCAALLAAGVVSLVVVVLGRRRIYQSQGPGGAGVTRAASMIRSGLRWDRAPGGLPAHIS